MIIPASVAMEKAYWFIFYQGKLLTLYENSRITVPLLPDLSIFNLAPVNKYYLGMSDHIPCYAVDILTAIPIPATAKFLDLRRLFGVIEDKMFWLAGKGFHLINWDRTNRYCGQCGTPTKMKLNEYAKECSNCGLVSYPRISPSIIVAVYKNDQILLINSKHFKVKFYTVISGFVEPGESLEECVIREIREEVGIEVKNISYFGSQPWPFPDSLMVGFTAEYERGEITIDEEEIVDAKWFTVDDLPALPGSISIARQLIDWFIQNKSKNNSGDIIT